MHVEAPRTGSPTHPDAEAWLRCAKRGDFASAWRISDRILGRHTASPDVTKPRHLRSVWTGQPLNGKRVLIRCYHGLGDTLQFIRFAPLVREIAREVSVWAPSPLLPLLASVRGIDRLLPLHDGEPDVDSDVDVEVMELPFVFRTTLGTIPRDVPYISAPPRDLPERSSPDGKAQSASRRRPRVGFAWRSGDWERNRSIPFDVVRPLFDIERVEPFSLQQRRRPDEIHPRLTDISDGDLFDAACRVAALDLMITIDSMPAHLAGALGIPVWTLLLKDADWRWMEERTDSPWYPTMRLFRQEEEGEWEPVVARIRGAIENPELRTPDCELER
jgi:hypothetical protein